jgi:hypothetical protein
MKVDFQTPNSNSCIRSTTNMGYVSKPIGPSLSTNTFYWTVSQGSTNYEPVHTTIGNSESGFSKMSIFSDAMLYPKVYKQRRADWTTSEKTFLGFFVLVLSSFFCPTLSAFFISTRQRGQGQSARSLMAANAALIKSQLRMLMKNKWFTHFSG